MGITHTHTHMYLSVAVCRCVQEGRGSEEPAHTLHSQGIYWHGSSKEYLRLWSGGDIKHAQRRTQRETWCVCFGERKRGSVSENVSDRESPLLLLLLAFLGSGKEAKKILPFSL